MPELAEFTAAVCDWLQGEHQYQFDKFDKIYGKELMKRRAFISDEEIPAKWHRNKWFRERKAFKLANQQVLKVCAASRAVVIYDARIAGEDFRTASDRTFEDIADHFSVLENSDYPAATDLTVPYDVAFPNKEPNSVFKRAGELAVVGVIDEWMATGTFVLPRPGLASGNL